MNNMGHSYENGEGVEVNLVTAKEWYEKSAYENNNLAQENLGRFYENGYGGLDGKFKKAFNLYTKSANQKNVEAMLHLARFYEYGLYVDKNLDQALAWYEKASKGDKDFEESVGSTKKNISLRYPKLKLLMQKLRIKSY